LFIFFEKVIVVLCSLFFVDKINLGLGVGIVVFYSFFTYLHNLNTDIFLGLVNLLTR